MYGFSIHFPCIMYRICMEIHLKRVLFRTYLPWKWPETTFRTFSVHFPCLTCMENVWKMCRKCHRKCTECDFQAIFRKFRTFSVHFPCTFHTFSGHFQGNYAWKSALLRYNSIQNIWKMYGKTIHFPRKFFIG